MRITHTTNDLQPDGTFRVVVSEVSDMGEYLRLCDPDREVGNASDGSGWLGDYGAGKVLAIDTHGFTYYFNLRRCHRPPVVMSVDGFGDEDDMRAVAEHLGWTWSDLVTDENHERFYVCDECACWVANADDSSHDLTCDCGTGEPCEVRRSRYGTFDGGDVVEFETTPIRSGYYRCFGCGVDSIDPHAFIVREVGR